MGPNLKKLMHEKRRSKWGIWIKERVWICLISTFGFAVSKSKEYEYVWFDRWTFDTAVSLKTDFSRDGKIHHWKFYRRIFLSLEISISGNSKGGFFQGWKNSSLEILKVDFSTARNIHQWKFYRRIFQEMEKYISYVQINCRTNSISKF